MTITVVTGAAGHLGTNLVHALLERGQRVRALVHRDRRALQDLAQRVEIVGGDVRDVDSLRRAFAGAGRVYHAAGLVTIFDHEREWLEAINVAGTRNVVEACLACGVARLVHISTVEALDDEPCHLPVDEDRPLVAGPGHPAYALSKAAAEREVRAGLERGLDAVIVYPTAILGPHDHGPGLPNQGLLRLCRPGPKPLIAAGFDWVDVRDVAASALWAADCAPPGGRYILAGHRASLRQLAEMASEVLGRPPPRFVAPLWLARLAAPVVVGAARLAGRQPLYTAAALRPLCGYGQISYARAARDLDHQPRPLRETIEDSVGWFEAAGLLP